MALVVLAQLIDLYMLIVGMSRALLKLSGSLVHDYATISDDGIVKLRLTAVFDAQLGGLATS